MEFLNDLAFDVVSGLAYGLVGIALMLVGYWMLDLLTPGRLGDLLCRQRRKDAGMIVGAAMLGIGLIVTVAIVTAGGDLGRGLAESVGFGLSGILLMGVAFIAIDRVTPGSLGEIIADEHEDPPVAWFTSASLISVAGIISAAIS
jgi:uncharacterized membrane protein YjfL (UPF0719 family)